MLKSTQITKIVCGKGLLITKKDLVHLWMKQGLKYYFQIRFTFEERVKEITSERINQICWDIGIIPTLLFRQAQVSDQGVRG